MMTSSLPSHNDFLPRFVPVVVLFWINLCEVAERANNDKSAINVGQY